MNIYSVVLLLQYQVCVQLLWIQSIWISLSAIAKEKKLQLKMPIRGQLPLQTAIIWGCVILTFFNRLLLKVWGKQNHVHWFPPFYSRLCQRGTAGNRGEIVQRQEKWSIFPGIQKSSYKRLKILINLHISNRRILRWKLKMRFKFTNILFF